MLTNKAIFNNVTIMPIEKRRILEKLEFLYFPITLLEDVRYTCEKIVIGN